MQFDVTVNFWAVLASAVASMIVGSVWYGALFGKKFRQLMGMDNMSPEQQAAMKKSMGFTYAWQFVASLVTFYVFAWLIGALGANSLMDGIQGAFWVWLGFILPTKFGEQLWGGKLALFYLGAGNMLVTMIVAGAIIGAWR